MNTLFLAAETTPISYLPVLLQIIIGTGVVVLIMIASHLLGPKRKTSDKLINFESGIPSVGNARQPMGIKYFLVAILFVLFDVEIIFFYPYAVNFKYFLTAGIGSDIFLEVILFVAFFLCGFIYIVKKGALDWEE
jgi:NADH-quinone oxidoreductase subunit A